jgi:hypothetical protein
MREKMATREEEAPMTTFVLVPGAPALAPADR